MPFEEEESSEDEEGIEEMAGINAEQFAALLAAARGPVQPAVVAGGTKKLTTLESTSGQDWRTWRSTFGTVVNINAWGDLRQRRELKAAMAGEANRLTADIEIDPPALGVGQVAAPGRIDNIAAALAAYERRFFSPAAGRVARAEYVNARQRPDETVTQWHGRLREMFVRAYPDDAMETSQGLITAFASGLIDQTVAVHVLDHAPETYMAATDLAQMKAATTITLAAAHGKGHIHHMGLNALHDSSGPATCWYCAGAHLRSDCAAYKKGKEYFGDKKDVRDNRGGSGQKRGRGRTNSGRPVNARSGNRDNRGGGQRSGGQGYKGNTSGGNNGQYKARVNQLGGQNEDWTDGEEMDTTEGQDASASGNARGR